MDHEYRVVPAPRRLKRIKGLSTTADIFAATLTECINAEARAGWEYLGAEQLSAEEPGGFFRRGAVVEETVLIFRRPRRAEAAPAPELRTAARADLRAEPRANPRADLRANPRADLRAEPGAEPAAEPEGPRQAAIPARGQGTGLRPRLPGFAGREEEPRLRPADPREPRQAPAAPMPPLLRPVPRHGPNDKT